MEGRTKVIVGIGFVALLGVAGLGGWTWLQAEAGYPTSWTEHDIADLALSADGLTLSIRSDPYLSDSCYEGRAEVEQEANRWTVTLDARRTSEMCTLEGCIGDERPGRPARVLAAGESAMCSMVTLELDQPVPDGVEVVPG